MHRISRVEISAGADADGLKIWNIHSWSKKSGKAETWRIAVMNKTDKIYVAGHRGLVGSAIVRSLQAKGYENIIGRTHRELDLTSQQEVREFFEK